ncbi:DUF512 domain-containing protein [Tindallia californiensis]|uniref:Putative radical SAM enzyme, TIGR03279 family n=1 Tax=Tindallia californiensis TaxID=159292 RepID=A0A1H3JQL3_9FIRM|nr:DUF512 domain-containing protein [Tindallia californiensis]SDY41668.1 putative radical SAM enzyme, TIGR03279 family [Tindallia californiensis]
MKKIGKNIIKHIESGSIAEEMGVMPGDFLVKINQQIIEDRLDYEFLSADDFLEVELEKMDGSQWVLEIEKEVDEELGIIFTNEEADKTIQCHNKCIFCFIDQMPPGMRESLYVKDDDARLSFLQGNYITLTNLTEKNIDKIRRYRISPLNISVHTTDPERRIQMLNNRFAGNALTLLKKFHENHISMNLQIVLCPGWNDGEMLDQTLKDFKKIIHSVVSIAIVPVGKTKFREGLPETGSITKEIAKKTLNQISEWQQIYIEMTGEKKAYASDELYLYAGEDIPEASFYDSFSQLENGVGMMALFKKNFSDYLKKMPVVRKKEPIKISVATGTLAAEYINKIAKKLEQKVLGLKIEVFPIENNFFGKTITVSGLITGKDLIEQLKNKPLGKYLLIPENMLREGENLFLDDVTTDVVSSELGVAVMACPIDGIAFIRKILRISALNPKIRSVEKNGKTHCCSSRSSQCREVNFF